MCSLAWDALDHGRRDGGCGDGADDWERLESGRPGGRFSDAQVTRCVEPAVSEAGRLARTLASLRSAARNAHLPQGAGLASRTQA